MAAPRMGSYRLLGREVRGDVNGIRLFQLDEYVGIEPDDDRSLCAG